MIGTVYHSPTLGELTGSEMVDEIISFINSAPDSSHLLIIGSDSQNYRSPGKSSCEFVTAVVVYRIGNGARYFWNKEKMNRVPLLREKIYTETNRSLAVAHEIVPEIREELNDSQYKLEIHIDVGNVGPTREMIKEVVGLVQAMGYTAKTKPDSWAASSVADKHT